MLSLCESSAVPSYQAVVAATEMRTDAPRAGAGEGRNSTAGLAPPYYLAVAKNRENKKHDDLESMAWV